MESQELQLLLFVFLVHFKLHTFSVINNHCASSAATLERECQRSCALDMLALMAAFCGMGPAVQC
jgi:hypothetical protein